MVTKLNLKTKFIKGAKPTQQDFSQLIDETYNERMEFNNLGNIQELASSGVTVDNRQGNDTYSITSTNAYSQSGLIVPSTMNKKFVFAYEIENVGTLAIQRWGWRVGYNNTGSGIGAFDGENVVPVILQPAQKYKGYFIANHVQDRPRLIGIIFSGTNGSKLKIKQKVYDVTSMSLKEVNSINWNDIKDRELIVSDISKNAMKVLNRNSNWKGKTGLFLGDSITAQTGYVEIIRQELGLGRIINRGISGAPLLRFLENVTQQDVDAADFITIYGCFNSFTVGNQPLGTYADAPSNDNNASFIAKFKYILDTLEAMSPGKRIIIIGTHNGSGGQLPAWDGFVTGTSTIYDYVVNGMKVCANRRGYPFINMYENSGINQSNASIFTTDGFHPNQLGNRQIGAYLASEIDKIQPVE